MKNNGSSKFPIQVPTPFSKTRHDINSNGWGFKDSFYTMKNGVLTFAGDRYMLSNKVFRNASSGIKKLLNVDLKDYKPYVNPTPKESDYPPRVKNETLLKELTDADIDFSVEFEDRFLRCHGQGLKDLYTLRHGKFDRVPDLVVWPRSHEEVETIVKLSNKHFAVIIPCGGSTNTMLSLWYRKSDMSRLYISLDTTQMTRILWIDKESMLACFEAGVVGKNMEEVLEKEGLIVGHEPDSMEMSTVAGWVATRSSGMKQQTYGNIENLVVKVTMVTSIGTLEKNYLAPRESIGPDFNHIALGSEGTMGVITKVVLKVRPLPPVRRFGSVAFPDFESGKNFMYEVSKFETKPSSLRLIDNSHIQLGLAFDYTDSILQKITKRIKQFAIYMLGFDEDKFVLALYLIEGTKKEADQVEAKLKTTISSWGGISGGEHFGMQTYLLTSTNCYIRDFLYDLGFMFDSIEPSVTWEKCWPVICAIKNVWEIEMKKRKLINLLAIRISQIYSNGGCIYLYYGIGPTGDKNQMDVYEELTDILRKTIKDAGGAVSHHHGIGKKNIKWYPSAVSNVGVEVYKSIKKQIDPNNVFDVGNLINIEREEDKNAEPKL